jgi:hypothetical protein
MRLYRIDHISGRTTWYGTQADASAAAKLFSTPWELAEVPTDKPALLVWLNDYKPGWRDPSAAPAEAPPPAAPPLHFVRDAVAIEDAWEALPLAVQLHYAALALERARRQL